MEAQGDTNSNKKVNKDLLKKQTEIALTISNFSHYICLALFVILEFILNFEGPLPYFFLTFFVISQSNTLLYKLHQKVLVVSLVFFATAYISVLFITLYSGGINSPFLSMVVVLVMGAFISSLKHGRIFLVIGILIFLGLLLEDYYGWVTHYEYTHMQVAFFALLTYTFIFAVAGYAGFIIANTSFKAYKIKKELEEKNEQIEEQKQSLTEKNKEITDSIHYAKRIQSAILPKMEVFRQNLKNSFILYLPKDVVSGDFYWMEQLENQIIFASADCTGHGVPGAMVSVVCHNALNRSVREFGLDDPGLILDKTREIVLQEFEKSDEGVQDGMDISLCALNSETRLLRWSGAYNPLWILRKGSKEIEEIKADKQPVGKFVKIKPFTTHEIQLNEGDRIFIFTDGFSDQFGGEKGKKYKGGKLKRILVEFSEEAMDAYEPMLKKEFEQWKGSLEQIDDVCIIGVQF